jgi:hypothetical protein
MFEASWHNFLRYCMITSSNPVASSVTGKSLRRARFGW